MDQEEINKRNEAIALFINKEAGYDEHGVWQKLQYHSSWDWLVPVYIKKGDRFMSTDIERAFIIISDYCLSLNEPEIIIQP